MRHEAKSQRTNARYTAFASAYWQSKKQTERQHALSWLETWLFGPYHRRFDAYTRLKMSVLQNFEQETCLFSCSTFRVKVMSQNRFRAKLCVRETVFDSSIQAHWTGDFMSQNWRIYGLSDSALLSLTTGFRLRATQTRCGCRRMS
jgi:hypothetical protein